MDPSTLILYGVVIGCLLISFSKDRKKTREVLIKAWKSFFMILPAFLTVIFIMGFVVVFIPEKTIAVYIGERSGFIGYLISSLVGAITLIPGFVAFPMAKMLLDNGAGIAQMAVFISTLMMVGVVTAPLEASFFGWKATIGRNLIAYFYSFVVGYVVWMVVRI
ncbi:MAG: permease [Candidatus Atribacteria bacterium]|nr:permease [Candidatus Atribacteria bacterium]